MRIKFNSLDDARPLAHEPARDLTGTDAAKVGENRLRAGLGERIVASMKDATIPLRQAAQGRLEVLPRHSKQHMVQTGRLLDGG